MDNTFLTELGGICGFSSKEKSLLQDTFSQISQHEPDFAQSISDKVQRAAIEFMNGTHRQYVREQKRRRMKEYEIICEIDIGHISYTLFRARIGMYSVNPYLAAEWANETHTSGYRNLFYGQYPDVLMNYYERINNRLEYMSYQKSMAKHPDELFYARDCIKGSRDTMDYTGEIVVLLPCVLCDGFSYGDLQFFYVKGGPGCDPSVNNMWTDKVWIEGVLLASGESLVRGRVSTAGIMLPERIPDWVKEKVKELKNE